MGEKALASLVRDDPFGEHHLLDSPHRFHFGDAGVGDTIHVAREKRRLVARREIAIMRNALVVIVGDEVEDVLFEVRPGAGYRLDLVPPNHLGEREAELGGAHRAGDGHEHLAAAVEVRGVRVRRVNQRSGIEMTEVMADESRNGPGSVSHDVFA